MEDLIDDSSLKRLYKLKNVLEVLEVEEVNLKTYNKEEYKTDDFEVTNAAGVNGEDTNRDFEVIYRLIRNQDDNQDRVYLTQ